MKTNFKPLGICLLTSVLGLSATALGQTVFEDDFDSNSSANWTVSQSSGDTAAVFAYDYSADGIPSAPNSVGGTTSGLKFSANMAGLGAAGISASPNGQSFSGDYTLSFDLWMNANGPFPGGGAGSTEFGTAAVGLAASALVWHTSAPAGTAWFAVSGEGGASQDFRAYVATTMQGEGPAYFAPTGPGLVQRDNGHPYYAATFPGGQEAPQAQKDAFAQQTGGLVVGSVGFAWREVTVAKSGQTVTWSIDGLPIAQLDADANGVNVEGNIAVGYMDAFSSLSDNAALSFGVIDNVKVEVQVIPEPSTYTLGIMGVLWLLARRRK